MQITEKDCIAVIQVRRSHTRDTAANGKVKPRITRREHTLPHSLVGNTDKLLRSELVRARRLIARRVSCRDHRGQCRPVQTIDGKILHVETCSSG